MNNQIVVDVLKEAAARYFHPEEGEAGMLVDEFNGTRDFIRGQRKGHGDAYYILHGLADYFADCAELEAEHD